MRPYGAEVPIAVDSVNEMFVDPDGCHWRTKESALWFSVTKFCGCGSPDEVKDLFMRILTGGEPLLTPSLNMARPASIEKTAQIISADPENAALALLHMLDTWELTEHGGSVGGAWLTARGKQFVEVLKTGTLFPEEEE